MTKLSNTPILPSAKCFFFCITEILTIRKLKFCKIAQLFQFVCLLREDIREFIFHKIPSPVISNLDMLEVLDLSNNYFMGMDQVFFDVLNRKQKPRLKMVYLQVCTNADICFCLSLKKAGKMQSFCLYSTRNPQSALSITLVASKIITLYPEVATQI